MAAARAEALPPEPQCEVHVTPSIGITCGDHKLDLTLEHRFRIEAWDAWRQNTDTFYGLRTRVAAKYSFQDAVILFGEFQDARIYGLGSGTSGAGALYRTWGGGQSPGQTKGADIRQLWAEIRPIKGLSIRGGRQDIKLGTQAMYPEANWKYLKINRVSQRLVGTVGWTDVERSNDGFAVEYDTEGYDYYAFIANPTTGVFDANDAYKRQKDILYGGLSVTAKRNTLLENTELRGFLLGYGDDRKISDGGKPNKVEIYTLGGSLIGVYPVGPGNFDLVLWTAFQAGRFDRQDHLAGALIGEVGYQLPEVFAKPWLRFGINYASGSNSDHGDHETFFNMLPTNHLYYGFADQLAFQNLVDIFLQLMIKPHEKVAVNLMFHQFYLANEDDFQYFGTGAFTKEAGATGRGNFGYGGNASYGSANYAQELDIVTNVELCKGVSIQGGYSHMWGDHVVDNQVSAGNKNDDDLDFGYFQVVVKY